MKRLHGKSLLALLLALALAAALFSPAALAETVLGGYDGETGKYYVKTLVRYQDYTVSITETVGAVPPGIEFSDGDALVAFGTPTEPGSYACTIHFRMIGREAATPEKDGSYDFAVTIGGEAAAAPAPAATPAPTATPVPANAKLPVVLKSPTGETVDIGKQAEFVARYDNAIWAVWHFVSPDGEQDYAFNEIPKDTFPGLVIMNGDNSHLILKKIPYELNGWSVYCLYSNRDGSTPTERATITVNPPPATPEPTPSPTPAPTPTPAPPETSAPAASPALAASPEPSAAVPDEGGETGVGTVVAVGTQESPAPVKNSAEAEKPGGVNWLVLAVGAGVLLLGGAAAAWFFLGRPPEEIPQGKHSKK